MNERYVVSRQSRNEWWVWDTQKKQRVDWFARRSDAEERVRMLSRCFFCGQPVLDGEPTYDNKPIHLECNEASRAHEKPLGGWA